MDNQMNQYDNGGGYNNGNRGGGPGGPGGGGNGQPPRRPNVLIMILLGLSAVMITFMFYNLLLGGGSSAQEVEYTQFLKDLEDGRVERVEVNVENAEILVTLKQTETDAGSPGVEEYYTPLGMLQIQQNREYSTLLMESMDTLTERLEQHGVEGKRTINNSSGLLMEILITVILPVALIWLVAGFFFRKMGSGGPMGVGKSNAKVYVQKETGVTFKDVAGEDEAKESLVEIVDFLHNPGKYSKIGAKLPKGALLVGPPGTGKTLLARAVAGEAHVPFFSLTGSDFIELYVGVGASRVRDLFKEANKNAPCIVFIDEIDAIGRSRDSKYGGGNEEREQTLNQLLSEMDGFDGSKGILILAATNRPEILDKALLRPGRFDRRIIVDKPDLKGRVEILKVHSKDVKMDETVDLDAIALATSGAVGSDLANMINEAAINAAKEEREYVNQQDLFNAVEQVLVGKEKKDRIMSKEERKIVSYHEVGHALISALQKNSEPVQKITIVPRTMGALGYVMHVPEEEKYLNTEAELRDMLVGLVGGRAAEEIVFETVTTGAANDIEKATEIARNMVTRYGMSRRFGLVGLATVESQYLDGRASLNCSDDTAAQIDAEVVDIIKESYEKALEYLRDNRELMDKLAAFLIEKETITGKEFMEIFRREKGLPDPKEEKEEKTAKEKEDASAQPSGLLQTEDVLGQSPITAGLYVDVSVGTDATDSAGKSEGEHGRGAQEGEGVSGPESRGKQEGESAAGPGSRGTQEGESAAAPDSLGASGAEVRTEADTGAASGRESESGQAGSRTQEDDGRPVGRFSNGRME